MSQKKFERIHPEVEVSIIKNTGKVMSGGKYIGVAYNRKGWAVSMKNGRTPEAVYYALSDSLLRRSVRVVAAKQGWRDARTGKIAPLQGHHKVKRSKKRLDSEDNLEGLSASTHSKQHEGKRA
jgi:hypothetical protein